VDERAAVQAFGKLRRNPDGRLVRELRSVMACTLVTDYNLQL
jgi:hypothetical protein